MTLSWSSVPIARVKARSFSIYAGKDTPTASGSMCTVGAKLVKERERSMQTSEQINELATALAKAQGEITGALKDSANPFFKSRYADLASCWDACRAPLAKYGLSVVQPAEADDTGVTVTTRLMHASGQWIQASLRLIPKDSSPQAVGSGIAYGRRYGLTAMIGIAQVDDDGNAASGKVSYGNGPPAYDAPHKPQGDEVAQVHPDLSFKAAVKMRELMEADVEERIKALHVLDYHDVLNKDQPLYQAASLELNAKERSAWKIYVAQAKCAEREDQKVAQAGKRF
jgi:hypothetical protein